MNKYTLGLILSIFTSSLLANDLICLPAESAISALKNDYNEEPVFFARLKQSKEIVTITVNETTGAWTLLIIDEFGKIACLLSDGHDYTTIKGERTKQSRLGYEN